MEENEVKIDYVTREDGATLHTQAQEIAARLRKKKEGKKLIYVKHPELPNTWIKKVAKPRGKNFINKKI